jgi:molecular chaperone GrpE
VAEQNEPIANEAIEAAADAAESAAGGAEADVGALQQQLAQLQEKLAEAEDRALRIAAEAQNLRRRSEKDVENAHKFALEKFAGALLSVADNLERALESANRDDELVKPFIEGVELTYRGFVDVLKKHQIEQINPVGEPFDPQFHEAMTMVENPNVEPNTVLHVMARGYTLNGRLLRAAMVVVAKGPGKSVDTSA